MHRTRVGLSAVLTMAIVGFVGGSVSAQQTTSTEVRKFEIVSVDGNKVVVKGERGAQEITVGDDFRLNVDGKPITVSELKPGMKGTATITTTTTVKPVVVTEVRNADVVQASGNSILVRGPDGFRMFTEGDVEKRNVKIYKNGQPVKFTDLNTGDKLTATIVTEKPPQVLTQRQVDATIAGAPAASAARSTGTGGATAPAPAAAAPAPSGTAPARRLPKTASPLPLVGLIGLASLGAGFVLTVRRRRQSL